MLLEKIQTDLQEAMKSKDGIRVSTLRLLLSAIHNQEIALRQKEGEGLDDREVAVVLRKQVKQGKESIEAFRKGKRDDLVRKEEAEIEILSKYLPQELSSDEIRKIVDEAVRESGAAGPGDFGKVMGVVVGRVAGRASGERVAEVVKNSLQADIV